MKKFYMALALATLAAPVLPADVGVSVSVNQPGLYGRIDIGQAPVPPVFINPQPVIIVPGPVAVQREPIYLHVPPGHQRDWRKHCHRYNACGQPVYFVREDWYQQHYRQRDDHRGDRDRGRDDDDHRHGHGHGHDKDR